MVTYYSILWMCPQLSQPILYLYNFLLLLVTLHQSLIIFKRQNTGSEIPERKATKQSVYEAGLTLECMILTK